MPFGSYDTPKPTPTPTFLQYAKTCNKSVEAKTKFGVEIIWLPGKFNNVTLQTHAFRYICDENHPLYSDIKHYFESLVYVDSCPRLDITIDSIQDKRITVKESPRIKGQWEKLGANAFRFKEI